MSPVPRHQPSASIFPPCLPPQPSFQANNPFHRPFAGGLLSPFRGDRVVALGNRQDIKSATAEELRLDETKEGKESWMLWGPYLSERQWGTVREDYSEN